MYNKTIVPKSNCFRCGEPRELATDLAPSPREPRAGDFSICAYCHVVGIFDSEFMVRPPITDEEKEYASSLKVVAAIEQLRQMKMSALAPEMFLACEAAVLYDEAIRRHAQMHEKDPRSWVGCEELDELYEKWMSGARAIVDKVNGNVNSNNLKSIEAKESLDSPKD